MDIDAVKERAGAAVESARERLTEISLDIHAHPELALQEHHAAKLLADSLEGFGFRVERQAYGIETAFKGVWGEGPVTIAYLLEYDALPEIGHACGHNLIAAAGLGGAIGAKASLDPSQVTVIALGSPAEEDIGGKVMLIEAGAFEGVDVAMMAHPIAVDIADPPMFGVEQVMVTYRGRGAHAAVAPETAVNALDGLVSAYQGVAQLRQHIRRDSRLAGVILYGGAASNIIPDRAVGRFEVRALQPAYLAELKGRLIACLEAGAQASGCAIEMEWTTTYEPMNNNAPLAAAYKANAETLGRSFLPVRPESTGSTDMGNVSWVVPSIHPTFQVGQFAINHTAGFTAVANTDAAHGHMIEVGKALAMTGADVALQPGLLDEIKRSFGSAQK
jgi:amidohydrolase